MLLRARNFRAFFSATTATNKQPGYVGKSVGFLDKNLQKIANVIGVVVLLSNCAYNLDIKYKWDIKESEIASDEKEFEELKLKLLDPEWMNSIEQKLRSTSDRGLLFEEVKKRLQKDENVALNNENRSDLK